MPALNELDGCRIQSLMVRDGDRAKALAEEFGAVTSCDNVADLVTNPAVNAVYISSPPNLHCEHTLAAAGHGKHVLCEKPMAINKAECERMIRACEAAGVHLEVCFVLRGWPVYQKIRSVVNSGDLGQVVEIRARLGKWTPRDQEEWRLDPAQSGGGALMDVGSHYLDLFRYLLGDFSSVSYMGSSNVFGYPVEESAFVLIAFEQGCHGILSATYAVPHPGNLLEIYGTEGTLILGEQLRVITVNGEALHKVEFPDYYSGLLQHFHDTLESGGPALASGTDGLKNLEIILAGYESGETGREIKLG
jgi:predicted dehydrogenase